MARLADVIAKYYYDNFDSLPGDKQFHFVSRLGSWARDSRAVDRLDQLRSRMIPENPEVFFKDLIDNPPKAKINAAERRAPYFAKYPSLRGRMLALFRVRHLLYHYDVDTREDLLKLISIDELYKLSDKLMSDTKALMILSTYAINYIYLVEVILFPRGKDMNEFLDRVLAEATHYGKNPDDTLLMIYLFTHCIIGQSNFYQNKVQTNLYPQYKVMLERIENTISRSLNTVNLDNKFEFLVCCKLADYETILSTIVENEARQSKSPDGDFLIDTINDTAQSNKTSFSDSEHRNVLYIMSSSEFQPVTRSRSKLI